MNMASQINVYNGLKEDGRYICYPRSRIYTWNEMERMFSETDVSLEELRELYFLYNEMAVRELTESLSEEEFTNIEDRDLELSSSETKEVPAIWKLFSTMHKVILAFVVGFFALELLLAIQSLSDSVRVASIVPFFEIGISLIGATLVMIITHMMRDKYIIDARVREDLRRGLLKMEITSALEERYVAVATAVNTLMMYQLLEEKLKEAQLM